MLIAFQLALKNLYRKRERSFLTIIGVLLAVGSFISLLSIAEGLYYRVDREIRGRMVDIYVMPGDAAALPTGPLGTVGITSEILPTGLRDKLVNLVEVRSVCPVYRLQEKMGDRTVVIWGIDPADFPRFFPRFQLEPESRMYGADSREIIAGGSIARERGISIKSPIMIQGIPFQTVGIGNSTGAFQDYFCYISLDKAMEIKRSRGYQEIWLQIAGSNFKSRQKVTHELRALYPKLSIKTREEYLGSAKDYVYYAWLLQFAISAIGVLIATTASMNTMLMSTYERIKEFGTLRSIGASRLTVFLMVLMESIILAMIGGLGGIILGVMGSRVLDEAVKAMFQLSFPLAKITFNLIVFAVALSGVIGVVGAIIPAILVFRMQIIDALRWE